MVTITALLVPIVLAAILVFIASSVVHMALPYHKTDYQQLPNEADVMEAMRNAGVQPGNYYIPWAAGPKELQKPEVMEKFTKGPVGFLNVIPSGPPAMGKSLIQWFVYCLLIGLFVAYLAGRTLGPGAEYMTVFRVTGAVAFLGYAGAQASSSIWMGQKWTSTAKNMFDGLIYALLTAGAFGWRWPE